MRNFQDTFETYKRSRISAFLICITIPLKAENSNAKVTWPLKNQLTAYNPCSDIIELFVA